MQQLIGSRSDFSKLTQPKKSELRAALEALAPVHCYEEAKANPLAILKHFLMQSDHNSPVQEQDLIALCTLNKFAPVSPHTYEDIEACNHFVQHLATQYPNSPAAQRANPALSAAEVLKQQLDYLHNPDRGSKETDRPLTTGHNLTYPDFSARDHYSAHLADPSAGTFTRPHGSDTYSAGYPPPSAPPSAPPIEAHPSRPDSEGMKSLLKSFNRLTLPDPVASDPQKSERARKALQTLRVCSEKKDLEPAVRDMLDQVHDAMLSNRLHPNLPAMCDAANELFQLRIIDPRTQRKEVIAELYLWTLDSREQTTQAAHPTTGNYSGTTTSVTAPIMAPPTAPIVIHFNSVAEADGTTAIETEMRSYLECVSSKDKETQAKAKSHLDNVNSMVKKYAGEQENWLSVAARDVKNKDERMWKALVILHKAKLFDFNAVDDNGRTALHRECTAEVVALLQKEPSLRRSVDFFIKDKDGRTPLFYAKDARAVWLLHEEAGSRNIAKKEFNRTDTRGGDTPLHVALKLQNKDVVVQLMKLGNIIKVDVKNKQGVNSETLARNLISPPPRSGARWGEWNFALDSIIRRASAQSDR